MIKFRFYRQTRTNIARVPSNWTFNTRYVPSVPDFNFLYLEDGLGFIRVTPPFTSTPGVFINYFVEHDGGSIEDYLRGNLGTNTTYYFLKNSTHKIKQYEYSPFLAHKFSSPDHSPVVQVPLTSVQISREVLRMRVRVNNSEGMSEPSMVKRVVLIKQKQLVDAMVLDKNKDDIQTQASTVEKFDEDRLLGTNIPNEQKNLLFKGGPNRALAAAGAVIQTNSEGKTAVSSRFSPEDIFVEEGSSRGKSPTGATSPVENAASSAQLAAPTLGGLGIEPMADRVLLQWEFIQDEAKFMFIEKDHLRDTREGQSWQFLALCGSQNGTYEDENVVGGETYRYRLVSTDIYSDQLLGRDIEQYRREKAKLLGGDPAPNSLKDFPYYPMPNRVEGRSYDVLVAALPEKPALPTRWERVNATAMQVGWAPAETSPGSQLVEHILEIIAEELTQDELFFLQRLKHDPVYGNLFLNAKTPIDAKAGVKVDGLSRIYQEFAKDDADGEYFSVNELPRRNVSVIDQLVVDPKPDTLVRAKGVEASTLDQDEDFAVTLIGSYLEQWHSLREKGTSTLYVQSPNLATQSNQWRQVYRGPRTSFVVTNLIPGKEYQFRVRSRNRLGASTVYSDTAFLRTSKVLGPPVDLMVVWSYCNIPG